MDELVEYYVYFGMTSPTLKSIHNPWLQIPTPLGTLGMAGIIMDSQGTGMERFRSFSLHALVLFLSGGGRYRDADGTDVRVHPGDLIRVRPGLPHQYGPEPGDRWDEIYIACGGAPFDAWYEGKSHPPVRSLGDPQAWLPRWLALVQRHPHSFSEAVQVLAEIHLLYNDLAQPAGHIAEFSERLDHSRQRLESWPANAVPDWERLAAACHCSYETWRKAFRAQFGEPPARYRRRVLMERAAELLRRSSLTNEQIAEQFGCSDAFHFSKLFKSIHGHSPSAHRRRDF